MQRYLILFLCLWLYGNLPGVQANPQLQLLIEQKQYSAAVRSGEKLLQQKPQDVELRFLTAYAYQMNRQKDRAIALYQALIADNPSQPDAPTQGKSAPSTVKLCPRKYRTFCPSTEIWTFGDGPPTLG